jgi:chaperone required for assembly of F1-ATPase
MSRRKTPGSEPPHALPKRVYKAAAVAEWEEGFRVLLDGHPARTPRKAELVLPTRALAEAVAAEWEAQGERIDPATMPLTRLVNTASDGVAGREAEVRADIVAYACSDLLCYRAEGGELARRQRSVWDPILAWATETLGAHLVVVEGIMPVAQSETARASVARALERYDALALTTLHVVTTLTGSALLALAHAHGRLSAEAAWAAAHIDEDWQVEQWGKDAEAGARRQLRWQEMQAASRMLALLARRHQGPAME